MSKDGSGAEAGGGADVVRECYSCNSLLGSFYLPPSSLLPAWLASPRPLRLPRGAAASAATHTAEKHATQAFLTQALPGGALQRGLDDMWGSRLTLGGGGGGGGGGLVRRGLGIVAGGQKQLTPGLHQRESTSSRTTFRHTLHRHQHHNHRRRRHSPKI